jgi:Na+/H+-dicarboxylate symporter
MLIAVALAVAAGYLAGDTVAIGGVPLSSVFDFLGTIFISALKMLIVPLIASSMIVGVAGISASGSLGRLGMRTVSFYLITTLSAILTGIALVNLIEPGIVHGKPARDLLALDASSADLAAEIADKGFSDLLDVFLSIVPANVVSAAASDDMLGIIFFSLLFGYFMSRLEPALAEPLLRLATGVFQVMMRITEWVMSFAPIGVFCLVAKVVAKAGFSATGPLVSFAGVVLLALACHAIITLPVLLRFVARVSPVAMYRALSPALLIAFSTASSLATLPVTIECVEKGAGVSNRVSSFVLPLGATVNMNGTALYECVAAMFIAQAYGLHLGLVTQFTILAIALVTSIGVPGIPSASLVAIAIILGAVGLPPEAIGILFGLDRIFDMARTSVNVLGDAVCAVIVARFEGEQSLVAISPAERPAR